MWLITVIVHPIAEEGDAEIGSNRGVSGQAERCSRHSSMSGAVWIPQGREMGAAVLAHPAHALRGVACHHTAQLLLGSDHPLDELAAPAVFT